MEYRNIKNLKELPGNPRVIDEKQFDILCKSIKDNPNYFEARPLILSDRTGDLIILAGNQRYKAAVKLELKEVPTFLLTGLTEAKEREIILRDNINNGDWDWPEIQSAWPEAADWGLDVPGFDFSPDGLGEEFSLKDGDKEPFQQMTFTLADAQAERIKEALGEVDVQDGTQYGNENGNGNKLHQIILEWAEQRK